MVINVVWCKGGMEGYIFLILFWKLVVIIVYVNYKEMRGDLVDLMVYKEIIVKKFYCFCEK